MRAHPCRAWEKTAVFACPCSLFAIKINVARCAGHTAPPLPRIRGWQAFRLAGRRRHAPHGLYRLHDLANRSGVTLGSVVRPHASFSNATLSNAAALLVTACFLPKRQAVPTFKGCVDKLGRSNANKGLLKRNLPECPTPAAANCATPHPATCSAFFLAKPQGPDGVRAVAGRSSSLCGRCCAQVRADANYPNAMASARAGASPLADGPQPTCGIKPLRCRSRTEATRITVHRQHHRSQPLASRNGDR